MLRLIADRLSQKWGAPVIIENRPGGNTVVAAAALASSAPDGYTFLFTTEDTVTVIQHLNNKLSFNPEKDLVPVTLVAASYLMLVARGSAPFRDFPGFIEAAQAAPKPLAVATLGPGSNHQLLTDLLSSEAKLPLLSVPYRGVPAATLATVSAEVDVTWANAFAIQGFVKEGKLKALAVTGPARNSHFPDIPSFVELGLSRIDLANYFGFFALVGTPRDIIERLNADLQQMLSDPAFRKAVIESRGFQPGGAALGAFDKLLKDEAPRRAALLKGRTSPEPASKP
jgi:tripartite-type tricarboxylate transporter receptor subunit TctC